MSIKFLNAAFEANIPSSADKFVLVALADFANEHGEAYPSLQTLSNKTSLDRKTVIKGLGNLSGIAVIADTGERKGKTKQVAVYRIDLRRLTAIAIDAAEGRTKNAKNAKHTENGTIPKHTKNGTLNSTKNGTLKQYQKRYTEPSVILNHQKEPPERDEPLNQPMARQPKETTTASAFAVCVSESFQSLWESSPLPKVNKQKAAKAWEKACKGRSLEKIAAGLQLLAQDLAERAAYVEGYDSPFWKTHLSTYISREMWKDEDMPQRFDKVRGASDSVKGRLNEAQAR